MADTTKKTLEIDLFSDIACPWCYIGEGRLSQALEQRPDVEVRWFWHPFQLQPGMPREGRPWEEFIAEKFGDLERGRLMFENVASVGATDGIELRFDLMPKAPNTLDAHRLILFARQHGRAREMAQALFRGYFAEGADINDEETLIGLGRKVGLDAHDLRTFLRSEVGREEVEVSQMEAEKNGINGVPFYIFAERYAISGAQPVELFLQAIDKAVAGKEEG